MSKIKSNFLSKRINNILIYGSCLLVLLVPIFAISSTSFPFISPKVFFFYFIVEILTAFWIYALVVDSSYRLKKKTYLYFIPAFLFIIWFTIAGILAVNPHLSFWSSLGRGTGLLTWYHSLLFSLIVASLIKKNGVGYIYKLMNYFVWGGFLLSISVWFGDEGFNAIYMLEKATGGGLLGNSSLTAAYLLFSLGFGSFLLSAKSSYEGSKWWLSMMMVVILFSPLFINIYGLLSGKSLLGSARGATLGIFVSIGFALVSYLVLSKKKNLKILGIIGVVIGISIFIFGWAQLENSNTKLHQKFTEAASGTRFIFAEIAQKSMDEYPWFGYGPENYALAFQENFNPEMTLAKYNSEIWTDRAHNIYYDIGSTGGYPSIVFYGLFILCILFALYRLKDSEKLNHWQIAVLGGLVVGYIFQNLFVFDSPISLMALFVLASISYASIEGLNEEKYALKELDFFNRDFLPVILAVVCLVSVFYFVMRPMSKSFAYYAAINTSISANPTKYSDLLKGSSIGEDWDMGGMAYDTYRSYNIDPIKIKNNQVLLLGAITDLKALILYLEEVRGRSVPDVRLDTSIVYLYNTLYFLSDTSYDKTLADHMFSFLDHAKKISPTNPSIYWAEAQIYIWKRDFKGVEDAYKKAIAIDPSIPESHRMLINVAKIINDQKMYTEALTQAEKDIPGFIKMYQKELNITQAK